MDIGAKAKRGILFDKDGTLFDFQASWGAWANEFFQNLALGDSALFNRLCSAVDFDPVGRVFRPNSVAIAGTTQQICDRLLPYLPGMNVVQLAAKMNASAANAPLQPAVKLQPLLRDLRQAGYVLGVATNDSEASARNHLQAAGVLEQFDFVAGCDSGFGAKPDPGQLIAFAEKFRLSPKQVWMVGDSRHDLIAARAAGMQGIGVLTGVATRSELSDLAYVVLNHIGELQDLQQTALG